MEHNLLHVPINSQERVWVRISYCCRIKSLKIKGEKHGEEVKDDENKVFQFANVKGPRYEGFRISMLTKPPYPSFSSFILALQGHEQSLASQKEEERTFLEHRKANFRQRGCGRNNREG